MVRERTTNKLFNDAFIIPTPEPETLLPLSTLFQDTLPVEIDVGCGRGRFLLARASKCPKSNFLGIDLSLLRLRKIDRKAVSGNVTNIRLIHGKALDVLAALPPESVSTVYIYFPDPWPKRRHHSRRLVAPPLTDTLSKALAPAGTIHLCTDHKDYYQEMLRVWRGDQRYMEIAPYIPPPDEETDFCLIFKSQGLDAHRCSFQKR